MINSPRGSPTCSGQGSLNGERPGGLFRASRRFPMPTGRNRNRFGDGAGKR